LWDTSKAIRPVLGNEKMFHIFVICSVNLNFMAISEFPAPGMIWGVGMRHVMSFSKPFTTYFISHMSARARQI
jgi:hypothetical protein